MDPDIHERIIELWLNGKLAVSQDDLLYAKQKSKSLVVHMGIGRPLWKDDEFLPRRIHVEEMREARQGLTGLCELMSSGRESTQARR